MRFFQGIIFLGVEFSREKNFRENLLGIFRVGRLPELLRTHQKRECFNASRRLTQTNTRCKEHSYIFNDDVGLEYDEFARDTGSDDGYIELPTSTRSREVLCTVCSRLLSTQQFTRPHLVYPIFMPEETLPGGLIARGS